jgi:putative glutamine amidotransferase
MAAMTDERPVIGLAASDALAQWRVWEAETVLLPRAYVDKIVAAGGAAVLVPPVAAVVEAVLPRLDGIVLCGGPDVDPARYGESAAEHTDLPHPERDAAELAIVAGALAAGLPLLGICRGLQLLNVARGGSLVQHIPAQVGHNRHAPFRGEYGSHPVTVQEESRLAGILGRTAVDGVPTYHHQAVARLGRDLRISARAEDGIVEAVEDPSLPFCIAVQWHPEMGDDAALFEALVEAARSRASDPAGV